jgi:hypothetical protein
MNKKICPSRERWHGYFSGAARELYEALQIQELEKQRADIETEGEI